jgi:hypothetical protein
VIVPSHVGSGEMDDAASGGTLLGLLGVQGEIVRPSAARAAHAARAQVQRLLSPTEAAAYLGLGSLAPLRRRQKSVTAPVTGSLG